MYLSTKRIHHYIEATVTAVELSSRFTIVEFGKRTAKPPLECELETGTKTQLTIDHYRQTILNIASEICSGCPLKGNTCRYGIDLQRKPTKDSQ